MRGSSEAGMRGYGHFLNFLNSSFLTLIAGLTRDLFLNLLNSLISPAKIALFMCLHGGEKHESSRFNLF